jgi:hypothetical protein
VKGPPVPGAASRNVSGAALRPLKQRRALWPDCPRLIASAAHSCLLSLASAKSWSSGVAIVAAEQITAGGGPSPVNVDNSRCRWRFMRTLCNAGHATQVMHPSRWHSRHSHRRDARRLIGNKLMCNRARMKGDIETIWGSLAELCDSARGP